MDNLKDSIQIIEKIPSQKLIFIANIPDICTSDSLVKTLYYLAQNYRDKKIVAIKHFAARCHTDHYIVGAW